MASLVLIEPTVHLMTLASVRIDAVGGAEVSEESITCHCYGITEAVLKEVAEQKNAITSVTELTDHIGAGSACRACTNRLQCFVSKLSVSTDAEGRSSCLKVGPAGGHGSGANAGCDIGHDLILWEIKILRVSCLGE